MLNEGKFIHARFVNTQKRIIEATWHRDDIGRDELMIFDSSLENPMYLKLLETFTVDEISTMTNQYNKQQAEGFKQLVLKMCMDNNLVYDPNAADQKDRLIVDHLLNPPEGDVGSDFLFEIKLKIFDLPQVVNSTNADLKATLRKATTPLEALYVAGKFLYE